MQCPDCHTEMQTIEQLDKYKEVIKLDNCPHCGSFWLDQSELGRLDAEGAEEIDTLSPSTESLEFTSTDCPSCNIPMKNINDHKNHDTPMNICSDCHGILLKRGQLANYFGVKNTNNPSIIDKSGLFSRRDRILTSMISIMILLFGGGLAISKQTGYGSFSADEMVHSPGIEPKLLYAFIGLSIVIFIIGLILSFSRQNRAIRLLGWSAVLLSIGLIYFLSV